MNILSAVAGANQDEVIKSFDDNELSEWKNDGRLNSAWITYSLERAARVDEICMKLTGWRLRSYPLEKMCIRDRPIGRKRFLAL